VLFDRIIRAGWLAFAFLVLFVAWRHPQGRSISVDVWHHADRVWVDLDHHTDTMLVDLSHSGSVEVTH
jgi:hypothetical protein